MTPRIKKLILAALIFLAAFGVRCYNWQKEGINPDEPAWQNRVENFSLAVSKGEWQYTQQSLHPGVTLSWLASIGRTAAGYNSPGHLVYPFDDPMIFWAVHFSEVFTIIVATSICCGLVFLLLTQVVSLPSALIGALFVVLDPFFIASSRVLQMDALLAGFMLVSFLAALVFTSKLQRRYLVLSGVFAGFSLLTKINGAVILPVVGLVLLFTHSKVAFSKLLINRKLLISLILFAVIAAGVFVAMYPAMWVQPVLTIKNLIYGILNRGLVDGGESMSDTFFWGQVLDNPGPWFYPVVILFRTTPLVLLGALLSFIAFFRKTRENTQKNKRSFVIYSLVFAFLMLIEMTIVAKKSERYILPIFLLLDLLAGVGFVTVFEMATSRLKSLFRYLVFMVIIATAIVQFVWLVLPLDCHYGAYYNPLVGGATSATKNVTVGFGEGLPEVADYINRVQATTLRPLWVSAFYGDSILPAVKVGDIWYPDHWNRGDRDADLVVFYVNQIQRERSNPLWQEYKDKTPLKTVTINGVAYAKIYAGPRYSLTFFGK